MFLVRRNYSLDINQNIRMISEDHVTLKTGEIQRYITGINYILKYIKMVWVSKL